MYNITENSFTKIDNNAMGNPRYVLHFLALNYDYNQALYVAKSFGGKKYHNKKYGGGIAFATYNLHGIIHALNALK